MGNLKENVTQVVPDKVQKRIDFNKNTYGKRIDQLKHIISDMSYEENEFIKTMYVALIGGRKITPKMENSITTIVKRYTKWRKT